MLDKTRIGPVSKPAHDVPGCKWKFREGWGWALLPRCYPVSSSLVRSPLADIEASPPPTAVETARPPSRLPSQTPWSEEASDPPGSGSQPPTKMVSGCATNYSFTPNMVGRAPDALPRWRVPTVALLQCVPKRLAYRMPVEYAPPHWPPFQVWLVRSHAAAPGFWGGGERIGAHVRFRPKQFIRAMRTRSIVWDSSWTDAGKKRWIVGNMRASGTPYSLYLGPQIKAFPHEADAVASEIAVHCARDIGANFLARRTPLISQNRLWRAVVGRLFNDATESRPLGKRSSHHNDQARPTYEEREETRDRLLYDNPPSSDREALEALSGLETIGDAAWKIAPNNWASPDLDLMLKRNRKRNMFGE